MQARILLIPLIILCGVAGGLLLVAFSSFAMQDEFIIVPYALVLLAVVVYLRRQERFVPSFRQFFFSIFAVFMLMSAVLYFYVSVVELQNFTGRFFWLHLRSITAIGAGGILAALFFSLFRRKAGMAVEK